MKTLSIDFYQVDMSKKGIKTCSSCDTVQQKLDQAVNNVRPLLEGLDIEIEQKVITVRTEVEARTHHITASPTIRIGSFDLFPEHAGEESEERVWSWKNETYSEPDREILIEAILRGYLGEVKQKEKKGISPYVMQFFGKQPELAAADGCCS